MEFLLDSGANIDTVDYNESTPTSFAILNGLGVEVVCTLLRHRADISGRYLRDNIAICLAVMYNQACKVPYLCIKVCVEN